MADFSQNRSVFIRILFIAVPTIIILRLLFLQVFDAGGYKEAAVGQAVYMKKIYPPRGIIYDRKNKVLMNNSIVYDLSVDPKKLNADFDTAFLCKLLHVRLENFQTLYKKLLVRNGFQKPFSMYKNLSPTAVARLQESLNDFSGLDLIEHSSRNYNLGCGGPFIGYINEISESQLESDRYENYERGDYIGINGLENYYEEVLRGKPGAQFLLRDVKQRIQGPYKNGTLDSAAVPGKALQLYLDADLQKLTEKLLTNKLGSAIAIDPETGGILAFASGPSFDPTLLTNSNKGNNLSHMLNDATKPLFLRPIQALYPPGSTFKPLTALVALDERVITPAYGYPCGGGYMACGKRIACTHAGGGHARNLAYAIANSCNSYFCHVFRLAIDSKQFDNVRIGLEKWHQYMNDFGLGHPIGIDIPHEGSGNIPDSSYFNKTYQYNWNSCNMAMLGMGQGELLLTPLQMANAMCLIANKGYYYIPHFVRAIDGDSNHPLLKKYKTPKVVAHIADSSFEYVIAGMQAVIDEGTGKIAHMDDVVVCGKTGTAQNERIINGTRVKLQNHSMFVAFAPRRHPKIAVAVCIENAGYGATWAGPIASLMIEQYLKDTIAEKRQPLMKKMEEARIIPNYTYILDSLDKQMAREKARKKLEAKDSAARADRMQDSLKHQQDSLTGAYLFQQFYWNDRKPFPFKTRKP